MEIKLTISQWNALIELANLAAGLPTIPEASRLWLAQLSKEKAEEVQKQMEQDARDNDIS